jgi:arylsulfatase A-like enzyme
MTIGFGNKLINYSQPNFRDALYYHYYEFNGERRTAHMVRRHYGVRTDKYKLIHFYNLDEWELYDLEKDPREMRSRYDDPDYAAIVAQLKTRVGDLQKQYQVPDDRGSVPADPPSLHQRPRQQKKKAPAKKKNAA